MSPTRQWTYALLQPDSAERAALALAGDRSPAALDGLCDLLEAPPASRAAVAAIRALNGWHHPSAREALRGALGSPFTAARIEAVRAMAALPVEVEDLVAWRRVLAGDAAWTARQEAVAALRPFPEASPWLVDALTDPHWRVRQDLLRALVPAGHREPELRRQVALRGAYEGGRAAGAAAFAAWCWREEGGAEPTWSTSAPIDARWWDEDPPALRERLKALARDPGDDDVAAMPALLGEADEGVRREASQILRRRADPAALMACLGLLADPRVPFVVEEVHALLGHLNLDRREALALLALKEEAPASAQLWALGQLQRAFPVAPDSWAGRRVQDLLINTSTYESFASSLGEQALRAKTTGAEARWVEAIGAGAIGVEAHRAEASRVEAIGAEALRAEALRAWARIAGEGSRAALVAAMAEGSPQVACAALEAASGWVDPAWIQAQGAMPGALQPLFGERVAPRFEAPRRASLGAPGDDDGDTGEGRGGLDGASERGAGAGAAGEPVWGAEAARWVEAVEAAEGARSVRRAWWRLAASWPGPQPPSSWAPAVDDPDPIVRALAAGALSKLGEPPEALQRDPDRRVREAALTIERAAAIWPAARLQPTATTPSPGGADTGGGAGAGEHVEEEGSWRVLRRAGLLLRRRLIDVAPTPLGSLARAEPGAREPLAPVAAQDRRVPLGRTGLRVSRLGISGHYGLPEEGYARAVEAGVNLFFWEAEYVAQTRFFERLTPAARAPLVTVCGTFEADPKAIRRDLERALKAQRVEAIGVFLIFWVRSQTRADLDHLELLRRFEEEGLILRGGLSTHQRPLGVEALRQGWDPMMVRHSAAHRGAERELLPLAAELNAGVITFNNLCYGRMLRRPLPGGLAPPSAADCYRYTLAQPGVSACLSAPTTLEQLEENLFALDAPPLTPQEVESLRAFGDEVHAHGDAYRRLVRRW